MTNRERFIRTLKCEPIGGQVPTFELFFYLTMEALGQVHPHHRVNGGGNVWQQMSLNEKKLHMDSIAQTYIDTAKLYGHSAIVIWPYKHENLFENTLWLAEIIREKTGDEYCLLTAESDPTWPIPSGSEMVDFAVKMYEQPEVLNEASARRVEAHLEMTRKLHERGHLLDGVCLCSDYCFNLNPFFSQESFEELIVPFLKETISENRKMGYYTIKHTDGNIMPILKQIADCKPDAIHSLDPQGGVSIPEVRKVIGPDMAICGNVNCGLLQTGTDEEIREDTLRSLREGMANGRGYICCTSNCVYTGMPLHGYELMNNLWREYGNYDRL